MGILVKTINGKTVCADFDSYTDIINGIINALRIIGYKESGKSELEFVISLIQGTSPKASQILRDIMADIRQCVTLLEQVRTDGNLC